MVKLVEWKVSIHAVSVVASSTLSTVALVWLANCNGNAFYVLFKKFQKPDMG